MTRTITSFEEADEVVWFIRGSKTDQYNEGQVRNHFESGLKLCPVLLFAELQRKNPIRFTTEARLPLFRHTDDKMLAREEVGGTAKLAAIVVGNDPRKQIPIRSDPQGRPHR